MQKKINFHDRLGTAMFLTFIGGFLDAYCVILRGGVFASAQTGNIVFIGVDIATNQWSQLPEKIMPIIAFGIGVIIVQLARRHFNTARLNIWRLWLLALQIIVLIIVGFLSTAVPNMIVTTMLSMSMATQLASYSTVNGYPYANTFTTGNYRKLVENCYLFIATKEKKYQQKAKYFGLIVGSFFIGTIGSGFLVKVINVRAAWLAAALLAIFFALQLYFTEEVIAETKKMGR
ncbi:YoaK family protein [Latilactobacillus sakei]|uniref:YoaK family protein n=1 Tax=Latilactobacillus sakei TaxID=1599 RepID=UPI00207432A5|nr:YoaK family protein [Latilactobacillus sakei]